MKLLLLQSPHQKYAPDCTNRNVPKDIINLKNKLGVECCHSLREKQHVASFGCGPALPHRSHESVWLETEKGVAPSGTDIRISPRVSYQNICSKQIWYSSYSLSRKIYPPGHTRLRGPASLWVMPTLHRRLIFIPRHNGSKLGNEWYRPGSKHSTPFIIPASAHSVQHIIGPKTRDLKGIHV